MFRFAVLFAVALLMISHAAQAFDEISLKKLKALNGCEGCDLSGANLTGANLRGTILEWANLTDADLSGAKLKNANIEGAKLCGTKTPWGLDNSGC